MFKVVPTAAALSRMCDIFGVSIIGVTHLHAQLELQDKGCPIKRLVVCNSLDDSAFEEPY